MERAYQVGLETFKSNSRWSAEESLQELAQLARTAGLTVVGSTCQRLDHPNPATYIGSGKAEEIRLALDSAGARTVIIDDELSPGQQRTLEKLWGDEVKVIDRTALILDIFALHAHTREGQIQVELAQHEYRLPRLTRLWSHLVRQAGGSAAGVAGGVGLRGPGETQLESDRRRIRRRIAVLRQELEEVRRRRRTHYRRRKKGGIKTAALVGYTNTGKSSLLNALSVSQRSRVVTADKLFATLDPATRRVRLPSGTSVLITDTVGFIKKLPLNIVAAFRATLEGIDEADLLLHIIDITHPQAEAQVLTVQKVLSDLGVADKPTLSVWNKIDRAPEDARILQGRENRSIAVSALTGQGIPVFLNRIERILKAEMIPVEVEIPYKDGALKSRVFEQGTVEWYRDGSSGTRLHAHVPPSLVKTLGPYRCL